MIDPIDLSAKLSNKELAEKLNEVIEALNALSEKKTRDRGPDSERTMTDEDARRIMIGDLAEVSHKEAASTLGLSYGQIYSARKGYTFKNIHKEIRDGVTAE